MRKAKRWRYYCDFCGKSGMNSTRIREHEARCRKNPKRRACPTCKHESEDFDVGRYYECALDRIPIKETRIVYDCDYHVLRGSD